MCAQPCSETVFRNRVPIAWVAGAAVFAVAMLDGATQESRTSITCTNPVSGASWQIKVDFDNGTVDTHRARITAVKISWFDPTDSGNYTLDRRTGDLTASVASSTGGYFRHAHCDLEKSR